MFIKPCHDSRSNMKHEALSNHLRYKLLTQFSKYYCGFVRIIALYNIITEKESKNWTGHFILCQSLALQKYGKVITRLHARRCVRLCLTQTRLDWSPFSSPTLPWNYTVVPYPRASPHWLDDDPPRETTLVQHCS